MHWAFKIAEEVIAKRPNLPLYVVASGITPSGSIHIGNYREFITNYYVAKALHMMGKKVKMIFSWDDFDRFRKVPKNITVAGFERYLGLPVADVPNPFVGTSADVFKSETFAKHFQNEFETVMQEFGNNEIPVEFIYQNKKYRSGVYNKAIIEALGKRKQIYDIIASFKTQEESAEEREVYYPVSVYCSSCGKDFTEVLGYDDKKAILEYRCKAGEAHGCKTDGAVQKVDVKAANNVKLVWKVDWPMRWRHENVVFEAAGIDHHSENGSFAVGRRIAKEIFGIDAPETCVYAWVGIKGVSTANMSSSSGVNITPRQLLNVYEPQIIRWLFAKYDHKDSFDFGFDDMVSRHYIEFDRNLKNYFAGTLQDYERVYMNLALFAKPETYADRCGFSTLATLAPIASFNEAKTKALVERAGEKFNKGRFEKVKYWLENHMPEKNYATRTQFNKEFFATLNAEEKAVVTELAKFLASGAKGKAKTELQIQEHLYSIINKVELTKKENLQRQQRFFKIFYNLLFGRDDGPRLYLYLASVDLGQALQLLKS